MDDPRDTMLDAALNHVPFDGWSETTLKAAARDAEMSLTEAHALFPRGAVDMALAYHRRGDARMAERMRQENMEGMRFRDRVAHAIRLRIEVIDDKEAVRRGATLFALPIYAGDGAQALWGTADRIWTTLDDTSTDVNWYTKRATLSGVYGSVLLFWLGDESDDHHETWEFIGRRIDDVMQIERMRSTITENRLARGLMAGPNWLLSQVRAPTRSGDFPGKWSRPK